MKRRPRLEAKARSFVLVSLLLVSGAAGGALVVGGHVSSLSPGSDGSSSSGDQTLGTTSAQLSLDPSHGYGLPRAFWGVVARAYAPLGSQEAKDISNTPIRYVLWPGGFTGDGYDLLHNRIYRDDGSALTPPASSITDFAAWCKSVGCHAILQISGEINSPVLVAQQVKYVEQQLNFHPDFWEIGNEPARWKHFNVAWTQWRASQHLNATPMAYALLVRSYITAIRAVDAAAQFIGLPGVGTGAFGEPTWIKATIQVNGPNLAAVGIHVYPAGGPGPKPATLAEFMATLAGGKGDLQVRVPNAFSAIRSGCSTCGGIQVFVTEMGSGNAGGTFLPFESSFPQVPYVGAEMILGMHLHVGNLDPYSFIGTYPGSLFQTPTVPTKVDTLYAALFAQLGTEVIPTTVSGGSALDFAGVTYASANQTECLLVVNADTSSTLSLGLGGTNFGGSRPVTEWFWNAGTGKPVVSVHSNGIGTTWLLPPVSIGLLKLTGISIPATTNPVAGKPMANSGYLGSASQSGGTILPSVRADSISTVPILIERHLVLPGIAESVIQPASQGRSGN